jgi:endonuclease/exonuclease/phosphatase family metal-dependent hydrolase
MSQDPFKFRILTVNTHKGFTFFNRKFVLHELREAVRSVAADVVFLQEVMGEHEKHALTFPNWPETPHYEFLAEQLWSNHVYARNAVYPLGHHGNALLSKYPILRSENRDVSIKGHETRGLLYCVLGMPSGEVHAICVHLGLREAHRRQQLQLLCQLIEHEIPRDAPLVIAGDFNDWRSRAHAVLAKCSGLQEVFVQAIGRAAKTFPARWPMLRLDRIYVRNAEVHRPIILPSRPWSHLSDHAPLAAEITV